MRSGEWSELPRRSHGTSKIQSRNALSHSRSRGCGTGRLFLGRWAETEPTLGFFGRRLHQLANSFEDYLELLVLLFLHLGQLPGQVLVRG
jgi:hypothetical protein